MQSLMTFLLGYTVGVVASITADWESGVALPLPKQICLYVGVANVVLITIGFLFKRLTKS